MFAQPRIYSRRDLNPQNAEGIGNKLSFPLKKSRGRRRVLT